MLHIKLHIDTHMKASHCDTAEFKCIQMCGSERYNGILTLGAGGPNRRLLHVSVYIPCQRSPAATACTASIKILVTI